MSNHDKLALLILIIAACVVGFTGCGDGYSVGQREGLLVKFSKTGFVNRSWEGELAMETFRMQTGGSSTGNVWAFSCLDEDVARQIETHVGKKVRLHYSERLVNGFGCQSRTGYRITKIEVVN